MTQGVVILVRGSNFIASGVEQYHLSEPGQGIADITITGEDALAVILCRRH
jgi:hypothetical protein